MGEHTSHIHILPRAVSEINQLPRTFDQVTLESRISFSENGKLLRRRGRRGGWRRVRGAQGAGGARTHSPHQVDTEVRAGDIISGQLNNLMMGHPQLYSQDRDGNFLGRQLPTGNRLFCVR